MLFLSTKQSIDNAIRILLHKKNIIKPNKWQAVNIESEMLEIDNMFLQMQMCDSINSLSLETKADLPWSEDHFQERLAGPSNPGEQYKKWPYYREDLDDSRFRPDGIFSHTYQERFWPLDIQGNRFKMGNWSDIKDRLKSDPSTRQAFFSIWHPEDHSNNEVRLPCTIGYWFKINDNDLDVTYLIRSCDARRHFRNDIYMTQRLAMDMINHLDIADLKLGKLSVWIGSFHCFISDKYSLKQKLK
jgi:thymidylate synthase